MSEIKVTYVDHLGTDLTAVNAARVSFGKQSDELKSRDVALIEYLADNQHYSPFEHQVLTVIVECPLYIRSQIHRHRTFAYNEISRRYSADNIDFYIPETDNIRKQSSDNKQGSDGAFEGEEAEGIRDAMAAFCASANSLYEAMVAQGVAKEQARSVLPMCTMTKFYMTGSLRNFCHFLELRLDGHAQKEAQEVAKQLLAILKEKFPVSMEAMMKP
jgi:thymidylate synthase (FAD)